jgi:hypothetical protein
MADSGAIPFEINIRRLDLRLPHPLRQQARAPVFEALGAELRKVETSMNIKMKTLCLGGLIALTSFVARPLLADESNKSTDFQFSAPVQIPGKTLEAGKYVFQLADSESEQNIVRIFSQDSAGRQSLVATLMAVPERLEQTPDKPVVHFEERPAGSPEAIQSWYYPGEKTGWEFVYPKGQSQQAD